MRSAPITGFSGQPKMPSGAADVGRGGIDPGLQLRQRFLRVQVSVVDVDAQRLLDHAQQFHSAERIDAEVGGESGIGPDGIGLHAVELGNQPLDGTAGDGGSIGPGR